MRVSQMSMCDGMHSAHFGSGSMRNKSCKRLLLLLPLTKLPRSTVVHLLFHFNQLYSKRITEKKTWNYANAFNLNSHPQNQQKRYLYISSSSLAWLSLSFPCVFLFTISACVLISVHFLVVWKNVRWSVVWINS